MRKEFYQMLEIVTKTASNDMQIVNVRKNPNDPEELILEATDTKRAIQIFTKEAISEGQYKIAKTGKEYALMPMPADHQRRFPDTDRVMYKDEAATFKREITVAAYDIVVGQILAFFGVLQQFLMPESQTVREGVNIIRPIFLDVLKPWTAISSINTIDMKATTPTYPVQLESTTNDTTIKFIVMPFDA